jgi:hypothetical protein
MAITLGRSADPFTLEANAANGKIGTRFQMSLSSNAMTTSMTTSLQDAYIIIVEDDTNAQLVALDLLRLAVPKTALPANRPLLPSFAQSLPRVDLFPGGHQYARPERL